MVTLVAGGEKARLLAALGVVGRAMDFDSLPMHEIFTDSPSRPRLPELLGGHERLVSCFAAGDGRAQIRLSVACGAEQSRIPADTAGGRFYRSSAGPMVRHDGGRRKGDRHRQKAVGASPLFALARALAVAKECAFRNAANRRLPAADRAARRIRAREKCWPLENFASLGGELSKGRAVDVRSRHRKVVFVLGPVEMERLEKSQIDRLRRDFAVLESPPLEMLAGLLADCSVYVGNDSGVSHLAAGVGAPCLALFGPTSPRHFAPLGPRVKVIAAPNMGEIVVNRVVRAARGMLRP